MDARHIPPGRSFHRHRFRAMGTRAQTLILGRPSLGDLAKQEIDRLERLWSRFLPQSEVARMNRRAGAPCRVSAATFQLIELALEGWRTTGGLFDPLLLTDIVAQGYDRTFEELDGRIGHPKTGVAPLAADADDDGSDEANRRSASRPTADLVVLDSDAMTVTIPPGSGFDPGGIGKGLAADSVAERLLREGAAGVLVNLGGDLRAVGRVPRGGWRIGIEDPLAPRGRPLVTVSLGQHALVTTSSTRRTWQQGGSARHHLLDPATGRPARSDLLSVTVIADAAWRAEILAKAAFLSGSQGALSLVERAGAQALTIDRERRVAATSGAGGFLETAAPARAFATTARRRHTGRADSRGATAVPPSI